MRWRGWDIGGIDQIRVENTFEKSSCFMELFLALLVILGLLLRFAETIADDLGRGCEVCGRKKRRRDMWKNLDFPGKVFCTKKCLNQYKRTHSRDAIATKPKTTIHSAIRCATCGGEVSTKEWVHSSFPEKKFCKQSCASKFLWKNNPERCAQCGRGIGWTWWVNEASYPNEKFCKESCLDEYTIDQFFANRENLGDVT